ncbi:hypothetical protein NPX13_g6422 [Xylaria arbuscula]|uniref:CHAT domain-containing protein n=1 Tax=Xylaria arbuscula TaxID=114810 RepID=A0A9W8NCJ8_9PEZI|nr:hypothetical protein NPX13_g6422 [Xylaria arbuscula]
MDLTSPAIAQRLSEIPHGDFDWSKSTFTDLSDTPTSGVDKHIREAIDILSRPVGQQPNSRTLEYLVDGLKCRFERYNDLGTINLAVQCAKQAVQHTPEDRISYRRRLSSLGDCLRCRHFARSLRTLFRVEAAEDLSQAMSDINEAVEIQTKVLESTPEDDPYRLSYMHDLAKSLYDRASSISKVVWSQSFDAKRHVRRNLRPQIQADLEKARSLAKDSLELNTAGAVHKSRSAILYTLALTLILKSDRTGNKSSLKEALEALRGAVEAAPEHSPNKGIYLNELGRQAFGLWTKSHEEALYLESISCLDQAVRHEYTAPSIRVAVANTLLFFFYDEMVFDVASIGVSLIPKITPRWLGSSDRQIALSRVFNVPVNTVALAMEAGKDALTAIRLLEQGYGALNRSLLYRRFDLANLRSTHEELAERFEFLQEELVRSKSTENRDWSIDELRRTQRLYAASNELDALIDEIGGLPGFEHLSGELDDASIKAVALRGPIAVINVSAHRCDALLIQKHKTSSLRLVGLDEDQLEELLMSHQEGSIETLEWLWETVANPILNALGFSSPPQDGNWSRVWWIPTAPLNRFPLHAAGVHGTSNTVMDRVVSSYSSSIQSLMAGRHARSQSSDAIKATLVSMNTTPGGTPLPFAREEVNVLRDRCEALSLKAIEPGTLKSDVLSHIRDSCIFHFAGHGYTDEFDPGQSHLRLRDWEENPMTLNELFELNLHKNPPFFAYLSACGTGRVDEGRFMNENLHLINSFQLAGFRHVIGTLWEVNDRACVDMSRATYDSIIANGGLSDFSVSYGLHSATRALRDRWLEENRISSRKSERAGSSRVRVPVHTTPGLQDENGEDDVPIRDPRDIVSVDELDDSDTSVMTPARWIPYVHFGP